MEGNTIHRGYSWIPLGHIKHKIAECFIISQQKWSSSFTPYLEVTVLFRKKFNSENSAKSLFLKLNIHELKKKQKTQNK